MVTGDGKLDTFKYKSSAETSYSGFKQHLSNEERPLY